MGQGHDDDDDGNTADRAAGGGPSPYVKETFQLSASHRWKASPGHAILVIDAGAMRFEYPHGWHVIPKGRQLNLHDRSPPDDEGRFQVTVFRLPRLGSGSWDELPLDRLLKDAITAGHARKRKRGGKGGGGGGKGEPASTLVHDVTTVNRPDLQYVWAEHLGRDPQNGRALYTRQVMARARGVQPLVTFDYYASRADEYRAVWQHFVDSLRLGSPVSLLGDPSN